MLVRSTQHVFGRNAVGDLIHYYWSPAPSWAAENLTTRATIGTAFRLEGRDSSFKNSIVVQLVPGTFSPASLPQGLTGGVAYVNHDCGVNLGAFAKAIASGASAVGVVNCSEDLGCLGNNVTPALAVINAAGGSSFATCGAPSVFRTGSVVVAGAPTATLKLSSDESSFQMQAAPGWLTQSDGDIGNSATFGFYHQELTAAGGGVTDNSVSDKFKLPRGTACGFHHTRNTPFIDMAGPQSTCMGQDPAKKQCPTGWVFKSHFDMSSGDGNAPCGDLQNQDHCRYFTWCEYQDPNGLCDNDPQCLVMARANGYAVGISSNVDPNGFETGGAGNNPTCPVGFSRVHFHDDGRPTGQGLSWCLPPIIDLPQGLTAGMAYTDCDVPLLCSGRHVVAGGKALGATTPFQEGDGFQVRLDGDIGAHDDRGFNHQDLVSGGTSDMSLSDRFKLLPGTTCGFHHTQVTPGLTCMGADPATGNCPAGWIARSQFDMSSGDGNAPCGNLMNQNHCGYFVWCEYQDPNGLCAAPNLTKCQSDAEFIGYNVGVGSNVEASGAPVAGGGTCPTGWSMSPNLDAGRPSDKGVRWCIPKTN